jgi:hypothetical protein
MSVDDGLRPLFRKYLPDFDWQSVETGGTGRGVPDSNFCARPHHAGHPGVEGWIEYKATRKHGIDLEPEQIGWITRRVRFGGRVFIAVRRRHSGGPRLGDPVDELWLMPGGLATLARVTGLRGAEVQRQAHVWRGGPRGWDWRAVAAVLRHG